MAEPRTPHADPTDAGGGDGAPARPQRLMRYPDQAPLGGVAEGLGVHLGIDPVLPRIVFVLLTLFGGGFGLLLYLILLVVMPKAETTAPTDQVVSQPRTRTWAGVLLLVVGGLILIGQLAAIPGLAFLGFEGLGQVLTSGAVLALLLIAGGVGLLVLDRREGEASAPTPPPAGATGAASAQAEHAHASQAGGQASGAASGPSGAQAVPSDPSGQGTTQQLTADPSGTAGTASTAGTAGTAATAPAPPEPAPSSRLGRLTAGVALVVLGGAWLLDQLGVVAVGASDVLALALLVVGGGLVVGGFWGRSRGLIAWGIVLSVLLVLGTGAQIGLNLAATGFGDGVGDRDWAPATLAELEDDYALGVGEARLDLTALDLEGEQLDLGASVGIGELTVTVPEDVDVLARGAVNVGEIDVLGERGQGVGQLTRTVEDPVEDPEGALELDASVGIGDLTVERP